MTIFLSLLRHFFFLSRRKQAALMSKRHSVIKNGRFPNPGIILYAKDLLSHSDKTVSFMRTP